ncbi:FmdB family zinc ribbon protein [Acididesulfobacillus acetoxydans]|uniref:FmdB family zinc ribbon protein n=1 Tax=Acididesulfobacillus acetoxydans TaxID=1561005 RepID=UPI001F0FCAA4|nr:zinc ribbon domain-containing protein [Acididesulfobacillus acetoxydans]
MPTYDLVCKDCEHRFSVFCSISQKDKQVCPQCGSSEVEQRFTAVNIGGSRSRSSSGGSVGGSCGTSSFG